MAANSATRAIDIMKGEGSGEVKENLVEEVVEGEGEDEEGALESAKRGEDDLF